MFFLTQAIQTIYWNSNVSGQTKKSKREILKELCVKAFK